MMKTRLILSFLLAALALTGIAPVYSQYAPPVPSNYIEASASIAIYTQKPVKKVVMDVSKINPDLGIRKLVVGFKNVTNATYISMDIYRIKAEATNLPTSKPKYEPIKYFYVHYNFNPRLIDYINMTLNLTSILGYNPKATGVNLSFLAFAYYDRMIDEWVYMALKINDPPSTAYAIVKAPPSEFYAIVNMSTVKIIERTFTVVQTQTYTKTHTSVSTIPVTETSTVTVEKTVSKTFTKEKTETKEVPTTIVVTQTQTPAKNTARNIAIYTILIIIGLLIGYIAHRR